MNAQTNQGAAAPRRTLSEVLAAADRTAITEHQNALTHAKAEKGRLDNELENIANTIAQHEKRREELIAAIATTDDALSRYNSQASNLKRIRQTHVTAIRALEDTETQDT